jgi:hypothetical protein
MSAAPSQTCGCPLYMFHADLCTSLYLLSTKKDMIATKPEKMCLISAQIAYPFCRKKQTPDF